MKPPPATSIDVFDPPDNVFGLDDPDTAAIDNTVSRPTPADGDGRPRWVIPVFAVLLLVIGATIVAGAVAHRPPNAAITPTTVTLAPDAITATLASAPPPFVVDAPPGYVLVYADRTRPTFTADLGNTLEVWSTVDATADRGAWFSVQRSPINAGASAPPLAGAYRTFVGDQEVLLAPPTSDRATTIVQFVFDGQLIRIESHTWLVRPLEKLVTFIVGGGTDYSASFAATDHHQVYRGSAKSLIDLTTDARENLAFLDTRGAFPRHVHLSVGRASPVHDALIPFAVRGAAKVAVRAGLDGVAGELLEQPDSVLQWVDNGWLLTLSGDTSIDELVALARVTRPTTIDDYQRVEDAVRTHAVDEAIPPSSHGATEVLAGPVAGDVTYSVDLQWVESGGERRLRYRLVRTLASTNSSPTGEFATLPTDAPLIESVADDAVTVVVASVPTGSAATSLRINVNGRPPVIVALRPLPAPDRLSVAEYLFTDAVPFTAQLLDAAGDLVRNWPESLPET